MATSSPAFLEASLGPNAPRVSTSSIDFGILSALGCRLLAAQTRPHPTNSPNNLSQVRPLKYGANVRQILEILMRSCAFSTSDFFSFMKSHSGHRLENHLTATMFCDIFWTNSGSPAAPSLCVATLGDSGHKALGDVSCVV